MERETVIVTGGSVGIGRGLVERLARDGLTVVNLDHAPPAQAHANEVFVACDLADRAALDGVLASVVARHRPTRLVANAGIARPRGFAETTLADFDAVMAVNVGSFVACAQALLPTMRAAGFGRVVAISSRAALGKADRAAYAASKAALHGLVRTMAIELGGAGVTVNAVAPGPIDTPAFRAANPPGSPARARIEANVAVGRMGTPGDVAGAVAFLLGTEAGFVTGQTLYVCGGLSIGAAR